MCCECNREFPPRFINSMFIDGSYYPMCSICALRVRNEIHGLPPNTPFKGELANELYEETLDWLAEGGE